MEYELINESVMCEMKEIFKYLDLKILSKIPDNIREKIQNFNSKQNSFTIDKTKTLVEQDLREETKNFMSFLYLEYCCNAIEKERLLEICRKNGQEQFKYKSYEEMFKKKENNNEKMELIAVEKNIWQRLWEKLKSFLNKKR